MKDPSVEDIYELSPMQQGMLFHTLYDPAAGAYFEQMILTLRGELQVGAFQEAWRDVVARHPILRSSFHWEELTEPLQIVHQQVSLPWARHDWRGSPQADRPPRLAALLQADQDEGFQLDRAPLMRFALIQVADEVHELVFSHHHLLLDGWSTPIILREVFDFYDACVSAEPLRLQPARPYSDYIVWLRQQDHAKANGFWREHLRGFVAPTPLVVGRGTGELARGDARSSATHAEEAFRLSAAATGALQALAGQQRLTLNIVVQGAWAILLSRYSGEPDVVFGATVSGRPTALTGVESMVGLFINTLPVRARASGGELLVPLLKDLQTQQIEREQYAYTSLAELQQMSDVPKGRPLFESIFVFESYPTHAMRHERRRGLEIGDLRGRARTNYPLTVVVSPGAELSGRIAYDTRRFEAATVRRMAGHLQTLLEGIAANPEQRLGDLSMLTSAERHQLLVEWNDTKTDYPTDRCVHELFEAQAARMPDAVAVVLGDDRRTYGELNASANQLARYLISLGVGAETRVAVCVERSPEMVVGLLGILKAGGCYVPLDPTHPKNRLTFMINDAQAPVVLTQERFAASFSGQDLRVVCFERASPTVASLRRDDLTSSAAIDQPATIVYTSGSTGEPKGVRGTHRGLLNLICWHRRTCDVTTQDRFSQAMKFAFDAFGLEVWPCLAAGATLYLVPSGVVSDPVRLRDFLVANAITLVTLPTPVAEQLVTLAWPKATALRVMIAGGDTLHAPPPASVPFQLVNAYGPTENTVIATSCVVPPHDHTIPSIGRPIDNVRVYILDAHLRPVPIGVPGEICIAGDNLALGYHDRPALTAEKFIANPFGGGALYRSGDLAHWSPNGDIEFLGRIDAQVKIRGFRIELGEIEALLRRHPGVREVVVVAHGESAIDKRLAAYVVPREQPPRLGELRDFLGVWLPDYMIPRAMVLLGALPMSSNGKVDRRALPSLDETQQSAGVEFVAPRTATEEALAAIWRDVLRLSRVGIHDNFFELGGHSLLATQVLSRVREAFALELPLHRLFEAPTVAALAEGLVAQQIEQADREVLEREQAIPLSFAQARLWFLDQLEGESTDYRVPALWRLDGRLHRTALERAIAAIVERHEVLRTTFSVVEGSPVQVIHPTVNVPLPVVDLQSLPAAAQEVEVQRLAVAEARRPFDLAIGPLLRATLLRLSDESHALVLVMHHIVCDGWSVGIFRHELSTLYAAFCGGQPSPLPALPIQYADHVHWQRGRLQEEVREAQLSYWRRQLSGAPPLLELPTDRPRPPVQTFRGGSVVFQLDHALTQELGRLSQRGGATLFMTLLAAFALLLSRYSRQEEIVIGSPIAGRNRREIEPLIGCFINTLALRVDLQGNPTFMDLLARVRQMALDAYAHQDLPFERLIDELQTSRSLSHNPLFQAMLVLQNVPMSDLELPGLTVTSLPWENVTTHFDLGLTMKETARGLSGECEYSSDLFDAATIDRMMGHFRTLLEGIAAAPEQPVSAFSLLAAAERQKLLLEWSAAPAAYAIDVCIHQLFERQAERTPDAIAVIDGSSPAQSPKALTYRELNERVNQLAHHLRALGVGAEPDTLVGLCVERSLALIVGLLGILKAGGAYVPLDPSYPTERLTTMIQDAGVRVLVTVQHLSAVATAHSVRPVFLDSHWNDIARQSAANPRSAPRLTDLAYVIYTSGSTGNPKGVMIEHRALVNFAQAAIAVYGISAGDRVLQFATLNFDTSAEEIYPSLACGAALVLRSDEMLDSVQAFVQKSQEWGVTIWNLPTAYWHLVCREIASIGQALPASLRATIVGGERMLPERARQWLRLAGTASQLMNGYGPTEATVIATVCHLSPATLSGRDVPIGRPIGNAQVYILDEARQPVPIGVPGELYIGGAGLARGYLNHPALTREKFVPHPFSAAPGARLYRTGDLARYRSDGNLEFLGRLDDQVKIRGFRVELGEIEGALRRHPHVSEAIVIARPADGCFVAYVVPRQPQPTAAELRRFLEQKLPLYMIPSALVLLPALPLTAGGKIDQRALPPPDLSSRRDGAALAPPRTPIEARLAAIWAEILRLERVGIHDNFFEIGGDSILSIQVVTRAKRAGISLSPKQVFQHQTIAELAAAAGTDRQVRAQQGIVTGEVPLTPVQHAFFEMAQIEPHYFNFSLLLETPRDVRPDLLRQVVQRLMWQHDALRLRFVRHGDDWQQSHAAVEESAPFTVIDLSDLAPLEQPAAMREADRALQASLSLSAGPIVRVALFQLGEDRAGRLLLIVHHLAMDVVSWWILIEDLLTGYGQLRRGEALELPPKTTSYQEWAHRLADHAEADALAAEIPYWLLSSGGEVAPLPVDYPPCADSNVFACLELVSVALSEEETRALLQDLPSIYDTRIDDVLLSAFAQAVVEWTGERTLLVELENHGREMLFDDVDLSRTVGWFIAEYPVLLALGGARQPRQVLELVRQQLRRVPRGGVGYGMLRYLRRDEAIREKLRSLPRAQVTFTYLGQYEQMLHGEPMWDFAKEARPSFYSPSTNRGRYLFNVHAVSMAGKMRINWTYSKKIHRRATVERLAASMLERLKALIAHGHDAAR